VNRRILLVPSVAKGNGSGHIVRCLGLAKALGEGASVFVAEARNGLTWTAAELVLAYSRELSGVPLLTELRAEQRWDLVVLDRRATSIDEVAFWERLGPVLALDEGGPGRSTATCLVDILPRLGLASDRPNIASLAYLDLPANRREPPSRFSRALVTFGGEDPAGLALILATALIKDKLFAPEDLTIVSGALRNGAPPSGLDGATLLGPVQDLKEHLSRYDIVFTQFGLTAYEAAFAGAGVVLLNPSLYHDALAREAGFPSLGVVSPNMKLLERLLADPASLVMAAAKAAPSGKASLSELVSGLSVSGPKACPRCASLARKSLYRDGAKSYFRCRSCGLVYLARLNSGREAPYKESYFFDEYRSQYGKTYLEDWPSLSAMAEGRLGVIEKLAGKSLKRSSALVVLDVGCAYGPYLAAARKRGQEAYGLDMSEDAARYVRRELGIPAASGDFLDPTVATIFGGPFDVLSMWYVIEHFEDVDKALRNAAALVRPGGVFAFSTPSGEGVSARYGRAAFFERSPADHFTVWEPSRVRAILKAYGFRVQKIRITGHHPERFPILKRTAPKGRRGLLFSICGLWSRCFRLGDTFEVYAVREASPTSSLPAWRKPRKARIAPKA
jgi:2-polyprenyl-3-methyl-5-hydroxy-6-metoxy-1,4-benzoquinol methylase/spore coat polysaccharide biosynthesis predicted glycosyltransferase SpsG